MILIIDNYDSFTYNLYQIIAHYVRDVRVVRNDKISLDEVHALNPTGIVLSPGPGTPERAGICLSLVKRFSGSIPLLGVCLGHQAIAQALGGAVVQADEIVHGKPAYIFHNRKSLFKGLSLPFVAGRYHSLVVDAACLPDCFESVAENSEGLLMAIQHKEHPTYGVQFHPESILTPEGRQLILNFVKLCRAPFDD